MRHRKCRGAQRALGAAPAALLLGLLSAGLAFRCAAPGADAPDVAWEDLGAVCLPPAGDALGPFDVPPEAATPDAIGDALAPPCWQCPAADAVGPLAAPPAALLEAPLALKRHLAARLVAFVAPADLATWQATRGALQAQLAAALGFGDAPAPSEPVRSLLAETLERGDHVIEKRLVEVYPGLWLPTLIVRPADAEPAERLPAVLVHHGHNEPGKTRAAVLTLAVNLARQRMLVALPDWLGFGDLPGAENQHDVAEGFVLAGLSPCLVVTTGGRRVVDYLAGRPDVDPTRLGATGHSGGAETVLFLAAADERIAAVAPADGVLDWDWKLENRLDTHPEHYPPGLWATMNYAHLLALVAPRAVLVLSGDADDIVCPTASVGLPVQAARPVFALYGVEPALDHQGYPGAHQLSLPKREAIVRFFRAQFWGVDAPFVEPEPVFDDEPSLRLQVPGDNAALVELVRRAQDAALEQAGGGVAACVAARLGADGRAPGATPTFRVAPDAGATADAGGTPDAAGGGMAGASAAPDAGGAPGAADAPSLVAGALEQPGEPPLPFALYRPAGALPDRVVLCLADAGRDGCAALAAVLAAAGIPCAVVELRGTGELADDWDMAADRRAHSRLGGFMMGLGDPLPRGRCRDVLAAVAYLRAAESFEQVGLAAFGPRSALAALLAATADAAIEPLYLAEPDLAFRALFAAEPAEARPYPADLFLDGLFLCGDGVDLLAEIAADRPVLTAEPLPDAAGLAVDVCPFLLYGLTRDG